MRRSSATAVSAGADAAEEAEVVVVTGASAGIGRATAHEFARRGARLVLAARDPEGLGQVERECARFGAEVLVVPSDVTDEAAMHELVRQAQSRFGRVDVWVHSAGVMVYGRFEQTPADVFRAVLETQLFGMVKCGPRGAAALPPAGVRHAGGPQLAARPDRGPLHERLHHQ